tara:strand:- start:345 stop:737 length:393 start_codon:yes stop_codon:yes gene_type:complete
MSSNISKKQLKEFGYLLGIGFPLIIGFLIPFIFGHGFRLWTLFIGIPSLIISIILPRFLFYPYKFWMLIGKVLGWINSRLILGLIFYLVLIPISIIMKISGYDPLKKIDKRVLTYKEKKYNKVIDLTRLF